MTAVEWLEKRFLQTEGNLYEEDFVKAKEMELKEKAKKQLFIGKVSEIIGAKEKAIELLDKMSSQTYSYQPYAGAYYNIEEIGYEAGKKCALIAVDEILEVIIFNKYDDKYWEEEEYWQEIKQELEKL